MHLVFCVFIFILKTVYLEDIKDYNILQLIQLGNDVSQIRPYDVTKDDVQLYLFTRNISHILLNDTTVSYIDKSKPIKFIIHGYLENHSRSWYKSITDEYLKRGDYNIIQVDWERPSRSTYFSAAFNTRFVGYRIADFIIDYSLLPNNIHVIGHSLGSHVAGFVGKKIKAFKNQQVFRITGLDPAGPYFEEFFITEDDRLDRNDAQIVDNIHTDAEFYGYVNPIGTLDMYINGGSRVQPGCLKVPDMISFGEIFESSFCSHTRSVKYFIESINTGKFHCRKCKSWENFINGKCKLKRQYVIGEEDINVNTKGVCFAKTKTKPPFLQGS